MSAPNIQAMRDKLCARYPSDKWQQRVARMSDAQVIAIYHRITQEEAERRISYENHRSRL